MSCEEIVWEERTTKSNNYRGKLNDFKIESNKTTNQISSKTTEIRLNHPIIDNKSNTKSLVSVDDGAVRVTIQSVKLIIEDGILKGKSDIDIINELLTYFEKDEIEVANSKLDEVARLVDVFESLSKDYEAQEMIVESDKKKLNLIDSKRRDVLNKISTLTKGE